MKKRERDLDELVSKGRLVAPVEPVKRDWDWVENLLLPVLTCACSIAAVCFAVACVIELVWRLMR